MNSDKSDIDKILGDDLVHDGSYRVDYNDELCIYYNNDNKPHLISFQAFTSSSPTRYELPNHINGQSTVTDFIESFQYVYELNTDSWNGVVTYVEERNGKFVYLSKEDLCKRAEKQNNALTENKTNNTNTSKDEDDLEEYLNPIYEILVSYSSYDCIEFFWITKVKPSMDWNTRLLEIE